MLLWCTIPVKREDTMRFPALVCMIAFVSFFALKIHAGNRHCVHPPDSTFGLGGFIPTIAHDIGISIRSMGYVLTSPLRWNRSDGLVACGFVLGSSAAFLLDEEVRSLALRNHSRFNDAITPVANGYATVFHVGPSALALYLLGVLIEDRWMRHTGQMLLEAVATIAVVQIPLSVTLGRARPFFEEGNTSFKLFDGWNDDRASFFSGHAMVAFSFSTILSRQIDNPWVSVGLYTLATMGSVSRIYKDRHWFSDTVVGSAMGLFVGTTIWKWHTGRNNEAGGVLITPVPGGLSAAWLF